ncbi:MAG: hypothetical protein KGL91_02855 [Xanthomonadaceae bacterium]|nr:hypothetical protein [Xanthomonadaceae bacterium]
MGIISLLWGVIALLWLLLAFIPLLGWGNWFMIPFAVVGAILAAVGIAFTAPGNRGRAKAGLVLNLLAIALGAFRLVMGGGVV